MKKYLFPALMLLMLWWTYSFATESGISAMAPAQLTREATIIYPPFVESFENGNVHDLEQISGWDQIVGPSYMYNFWTANNSYTNYNRSPKTGSWNAFLSWNGQSCMVRPISLIAGRTYYLEFYARQDKARPADAWVRGLLGTGPSLDELTQVIVAQTGLTNGVYQRLYGEFSVASTGIYYIGIQGYMINNLSYYISLDDITIGITSSDPLPASNPSPENGSTMASAPSLTLSWINSGNVGKFDLYLSTDEAEVQALAPGCRVATNQANPLNSYACSNLPYSSTYYWRVVPKSPSGVPTTEETSVWSFTTVPDPVKTLPWTEDFGGVANGELPYGWERTHGNWSVYESNYVGAASPELVFYWDPNQNATHRVISPPMRGYDSTGYQLSFRHYIEPYANATYRVEISLNKTTWTNLWSVANPGAAIGTEKKVIEIPASYVGQIFYLSWTYVGKAENTYGWWVDDIVVKKIPIMELPAFEDFASCSNGELPEGWAVSHSNWLTWDSVIAGGSAPELVFFYDPELTSTFRAITPRILGHSANGYKVSFKHAIYYYANATYRLEISANKTSWTTLASWVNPQDYVGPETVSFTIPQSYIGNYFFLSWTYVGNSFNTSGWSIDDIAITEILTTPPEPVTLLSPVDGAMEVSLSTLVFSWEPSQLGNETHRYQVYVSADADPAANPEFSWETINTSLELANTDWSLATEQRYYWTVRAVNDTYGAGQCPEPFYFDTELDPVFQNVLLNGEVNIYRIMLSWQPYNMGNTLRWDNGTNTDVIGMSGGGTFSVAARFESNLLSFFAGQYLNMLSIYANDVSASYTLKVWTGDDGRIDPSQEIYSLPITVTDAGWQHIDIPSILIPETGSLWLGYETTHPANAYPAGSDNGPAKNNYGNLILIDGNWYTLLDLAPTANNNWNIFGTVAAEPSDRGMARLQNKPIHRSDSPKPDFRIAIEHTLNQNTETRSFYGYEIYRNDSCITPSPIAELSYTDADLAPGIYTYRVKALFSSQDVESNEWTGEVISIDPLGIPFTETWDSHSFATNYWETSAENWYIETTEGNPAPAALFTWLPMLTDYSEYLSSFTIDGSGFENVMLSYDLAFNNFSTEALNYFGVEVWDGDEWNRIATYDSNMNSGEGWAFTTLTHDISEYAAGREFKIRFVAFGEDNYYFWDWQLDNISVYTNVEALDTPQLFIFQEDSQILVVWNPIPNAEWYAIYASLNPYAGFVYLDSLPAEYNGFSWASEDNNAFFKVKAGTGPLPRGNMLLQGIKR